LKAKESNDPGSSLARPALVCRSTLCKLPGGIKERSDDLDGAVIVAVVAVWVVQMAIDEVIGVVAVRNRLVATTRAMHMALVVLAAIVILSAAIWVSGGHFNAMLFNLTASLVVQMTIMQIVGVPVVLNRCVPAAGTVLVSVFALVLASHVNLLPGRRSALVPHSIPKHAPAR
jgi:hypothetical protein